MADILRYSLPASMFVGDNLGVLDAGDIPALPANVHGRATMKFPDGADESAAVSQSFTVPDNWTTGSGAKLRIHYFGDASGGENEVDIEAAFECLAESEAVDMHASGDSFAAAQTVFDAVDASAGELNVVEIPFTQAQADAIDAGASCRIVIRRDSDESGGANEDDYADAIWVTHLDLLEVTA